MKSAGEKKASEATTDFYAKLLLQNKWYGAPRNAESRHGQHSRNSRAGKSGAAHAPATQPQAWVRDGHRRRAGRGWLSTLRARPHPLLALRARTRGRTLLFGERGAFPTALSRRGVTRGETKGASACFAGRHPEPPSPFFCLKRAPHGRPPPQL